jgi:hypothetical protein
VFAAIVSKRSWQGSSTRPRTRAGVELDRGETRLTELLDDEVSVTLRNDPFDVRET